MARTKASTLEFINEIFPTGMHLYTSSERSLVYSEHLTLDYLPLQS